MLVYLLAVLTSLFVLGVLVLSVYRILHTVWQHQKIPAKQKLSLKRSSHNPVLEPEKKHPWQAEAVFNPAAVLCDEQTHLLYRAIGSDGVSRIGYARSSDGVVFTTRLSYPVYTHGERQVTPIPKYLKQYNPQLWASGGSWGGAEDPRAVIIDDTVFLTFTSFEGWHSIRMTLCTIPKDDFRKGWWNWSAPKYLSPKNAVHKNWVLFPEKINGKFAVLTSITPEIQITYYDDLDDFEKKSEVIESTFAQKKLGDERWEGAIRGIGPPPLRTKYGWLVLYHATDRHEPHRYKLGAMILDYTDPTHIVHVANNPILAPDEWYENEGKPGVVYVCGAVINNGTLFVYYGGADRVVAVACAPCDALVEHIMNNDALTLTAQQTQEQ